MATSCNPDFHDYDFHYPDFDTRATFPIRFRRFLFSLFPQYFIENDTYKNTEDEGLLERYMSVFGYELDMEVIPTLGCYLEIIDAQISDKKYLVHIADIFGNPPDIFKDETIYRNLLTYIIPIYKIKGTKGAYELFFSILGFGVNLIEIPILDVTSTYDLGGEYDTGEENALYDITGCETCSYYDIEFYPLHNPDAVVDAGTLAKLRSVVFFNEPINARLRNFIGTLKIEDSFKVLVEDEEENLVETVKTYDVESEYDDDNEYDDIFTIGGTPLVSLVEIIVGEVPTEPEISLRIQNNFEPAVLDTVLTTFGLRIFNTNNEPIVEVGGPLGPLVETDDIISTILLQGQYGLIEPSYVVLQLQLVLSDGRISNTNITHGIGAGTTITEAYFI